MNFAPVLWERAKTDIARNRTTTTRRRKLLMKHVRTVKSQRKVSYRQATAKVVHISGSKSPERWPVSNLITIIMISSRLFSVKTFYYSWESPRNPYFIRLLWNSSKSVFEMLTKSNFPFNAISGFGFPEIKRNWHKILKIELVNKVV